MEALERIVEGALPDIEKKRDESTRAGQRREERESSNDECRGVEGFYVHFGLHGDLGGGRVGHDQHAHPSVRVPGQARGQEKSQPGSFGPFPQGLLITKKKKQKLLNR